jgi:DNA-binding beta-propeller fold protein YncE
MHIQKSTLSVVLIAIFIIAVLFAQTGLTKSLYVNVITPGSVRAYKIVGDHIQYQTNAQNLVYYGYSPIGLALDPDSGIAFITYEDQKIIELLNAKTMVSLQKITTVKDASNLAGVTFDKSKQKLYVVERRDNRLYVYLWNPVTRNLNLEGDIHKTLENIGSYPDGAYGVALNELTNRLYVTNATNTVHYYDTATWEHRGSIPIVVGGTPRQAVGIAIDSNRRYMSPAHSPEDPVAIHALSGRI